MFWNCESNDFKRIMYSSLFCVETSFVMFERFNHVTHNFRNCLSQPLEENMQIWQSKLANRKAIVLSLFLFSISIYETQLYIDYNYKHLRPLCLRKWNILNLSPNYIFKYVFIWKLPQPDIFMSMNCCIAKIFLFFPPVSEVSVEASENVRSCWFLRPPAHSNRNLGASSIWNIRLKCRWICHWEDCSSFGKSHNAEFSYSC